MPRLSREATRALRDNAKGKVLHWLTTSRETHNQPGILHLGAIDARLSRSAHREAQNLNRQLPVSTQLQGFRIYGEEIKVAQTEIRNRRCAEMSAPGETSFDVAQGPRRSRGSLCDGSVSSCGKD